MLPASGIELELREALNETYTQVAIRIMQKALDYGALTKPPEWFNNDDNFARVMQETLYLQRLLISEIRRLTDALDRPELTLRGWKARSPARVLLLAGWLFARNSSTDVSIDLRDSELTPHDGEQLAALLGAHPRLTTIDVRGNESLGDAGTAALCSFMATNKVTSVVSVARSLCGVTPAKSRLDVPKLMKRCELNILCSELEANVYGEGVSASMGSRSKSASAMTSLNRRGASSLAQWLPLLWAAKDNNLLVAEWLLDHGHDPNKHEVATDKGSSAYSPVHWAAQKGYLDMLKLLHSRGAIVTVKDKHGNTPRSLAEKKGFKEVVEMLTWAEAAAPVPSALSRQKTRSVLDA